MPYDPQSWSLPPSAQRVTNAGANRGHCHWACKGLRMLCNPSRVHHLWVRRGWPVLRDLFSVLFSLDGHRSASAVQPSNEVIAFERVGGVANASQHLIRVIFTGCAQERTKSLLLITSERCATLHPINYHHYQLARARMLRIRPFGFVTILCTRVQMLRRPNKQHLRENPR